MKKIIFLFITLFSFSQALSMEEKEPKWVFLRTINQPDTTKDDWRIMNSQLQLNANATDPITLETFDYLMKQAYTKQFPYILIGLRKNGFYHFYDGFSLWPLLDEKWKDPQTNEAPDAAAIFVAGDNEQLTFLVEVDDTDFAYLTIIHGLSADEIKKPGYGHLLIADFLKDRAKELSSEQEKKETLQHARQWYEWALKYLPKNSDEYQKAKRKRDAILI